MSKFKEIAKRVMLAESKAILSAADFLDSGFEDAFRIVMKSSGNFVISGIGI